MLPRFYLEAIQAIQSHLAVLFPQQLEQPEPVHTEPAVQAARDWITRLGRPASREPNSSYQRIADLRVSTTDPGATLMRKKGGGGAHLGYHTHYVVGGRQRQGSHHPERLSHPGRSAGQPADAGSTLASMLSVAFEAQADYW